MGGPDASVDSMKEMLEKVTRFGDMLRHRILNDTQKEIEDKYKRESDFVIKWLNHKLLSTDTAVYLVRKVWFEMYSYKLFLDTVKVSFDHGQHICSVSTVTLEGLFVFKDIEPGMKDAIFVFNNISYSVERPNKGHVQLFRKVEVWANKMAGELELLSMKDAGDATGKSRQKRSGTVRKGGCRGGNRKPVVRPGDGEV